MIENKGANLQEHRGTDLLLRIVRDSGGAGHGGGPMKPSEVQYHKVTSLSSEIARKIKKI